MQYILLFNIVLLAYIGYSDLRFRKISNKSICLLLVLAILSNIGASFAKNIVGIFVIFVPILILYIITSKLGAGDVKMVFCLCFLLPMTELATALFIGMSITLLAVTIASKIKNTNCYKNIPLGTFMSLGAVCVLLVR